MRWPVRVASNGVWAGVIHTLLVDRWSSHLAQQLGSGDPRVGEEFLIKSVSNKR
jgi:hypothetical protein